MKVYVSGMGIVSAAGHTVSENWQSVLAGQVCTKPIQGWSLPNWPVQQGGELVDFQPAQRLPDKKLMKAISRQDAIGLAAVSEAIHMSGLLPYRDGLSDVKDFNEMTGVFVGSPGNKYFQQYDFLPLLSKTKGDMQAFAKELFNEVHPMWLLRILPNNVLAYTGMLYQFKGPNHNIANHAVGGMQALIEAFHAIVSGQIERAVVVGYDMGIDPQALFYYEKLGLLSKTGLCPFDAAHDGTVLADGAAALVIESENSIKARQGQAYCEIQGGISATECQGLFGVDSEAHALEALLRKLITQLALKPKDITFLVAHGNGSKGSDESEARALQHVFGEYDLPITAFKWCMGHTLVASGLVDLILAAKAFQEQLLPGIASLKKLSVEAASLNMHQENRSLKAKGTALVINRGFASMNACLAIKACETTLS